LPQSPSSRPCSRPAAIPEPTLTAPLSPEADALLASCSVECNQKQKALHEGDLAEVVSYHADLERGIATFHKASGAVLETSFRDAKLSPRWETLA
jgi:hypothetical protein